VLLFFPPKAAASTGIFQKALKFCKNRERNQYGRIITACLSDKPGVGRTSRMKRLSFTPRHCEPPQGGAAIHLVLLWVLHGKTVRCVRIAALPLRAPRSLPRGWGSLRSLAMTGCEQQHERPGVGRKFDSIAGKPYTYRFCPARAYEKDERR
jgi:hypothetical protein